jgi:hypothetical protein
MTHRRVLLFLLFVSVLALPTRGPSRAQEKAPVADIAVVSSVSDLLAQPAIDLGGGVKVRLGIEARECQVGAGTLIYCATEGFSTPSPWTYSTRTLGPVEVALVQSGTRLYWGQGGRRSGGGDPDPWVDSKALLFVRELVATAAGTLEVVVEAGEPRHAVARCKLEVADHPAHSWARFETVGTHALSAKVFNVRNRSDGAALPCWSGTTPITIRGSETRETHPDEDCARLARTDALPRLIPVEVDPGTMLTLTDDVLELRADPPLWNGPGRFLVRYWVNGKPFPIARFTTFFPGGFAGPSGHESKRARFHLELDPARLGAATGDRVAVQLLYCPFGSEWVGTPSHLIEPIGPNAYTRLSNTVEVVVK